MERDIIVTAHLQDDASWLFHGQVIDYGTDGIVVKDTSADTSIGSTTGISDGQVMINGTSLLMGQLAQDLT